MLKLWVLQLLSQHRQLRTPPSFMLAKDCRLASTLGTIGTIVPASSCMHNTYI